MTSIGLFNRIIVDNKGSFYVVHIYNDLELVRSIECTYNPRPDILKFEKTYPRGTLELQSSDGYYYRLNGLDS